MTDRGPGPLAEWVWPEVAGSTPRPLVVVPIGSFEQHGPHLPLDTDTVIAEALADALCRRVAPCALGPTIAVGASGEHQGFPGTLSIGTDALVAVLVELARSADWASGLVFVNGHGGNAAALARAGGVIAGEGRRALAWSPRIAGSDLHAGCTETSLMLHLAPQLVRVDAAEAGPTPAWEDLRSRGVRALSPNGVLGDPAAASAAAGAELFAGLADDLVATVVATAERWTR